MSIRSPYWLLLLVMAGQAFAAAAKISSTQVVVDSRLKPTNVSSMSSYLDRFVGEEASPVNARAAQTFLSDLYFVSQASCSIEHDLLLCRVEPKYFVRKISIKNLSAVLLESELRRKLPIQEGQLIDFNEEKAETLKTIVRTRIETFLRKSGFYGARLTLAFTKREDSLAVELRVVIEGGEFVRVNNVRVEGDLPMSSLAVKLYYKRMCLSFTRIFDAVALGTLSCYSRESEREATENLQEKLAAMGYVKASIRVSHQWIDPQDRKAPKNCRARDPSDQVSRCIDLRVDVDKGPLVKTSITMMDGHMVGRNALTRFIASIFAVDQFSRVTSPDRGEEIPADRLIIKQELEKRINFVEAKNIDEQELNLSAQKMTEYLVAKGYTLAEVVPTAFQEDTSEIMVNFQIYAGQPFAIKAVSVEPNQFSHLYTEDELGELIKVRAFSSPGSLSYEEVSSALEEVIRRATDRGFYKVTGKAEMSTLDSGDIEVRFFLTSLPRETISQILIINGEDKLNDEAIPSLKNCDNFHHNLCQGSSLVRGAIASDESKLADFYQANDYLYAGVRSELKEGPNGYELIFHVFDSRYGEGSERALHKQLIKDIIISGNRFTRESVIKRLFPTIRSGQQLDTTALKKGVSNLRESGRFSQIDHKLMEGQENSEDIYYALQLVERPSLNLDTGIAISTDRLLMLQAELEESNLFSSMLMLKTKIALGLFWGRQSSLTNKLVWPFIWGKPFIFTLHAPMIIYDDKTHRRDPFRRLQSRLVAGIDWRANANLMPYIKYSIIHSKVQTGKPPSEPLGERFKTLDGLIPTLRVPGKIMGVVKPGISYINLDNLIDPHFGIDTNNWLEISGGPFKNLLPFWNLGTQNRGFIPLGPCTLALQATFMRAFMVPSQHNFAELKDVSEMDKLGGDRSVRGYGDGDIGIDSTPAELGPLSGYMLNIANAELRFPLTKGSTLGNFSGAFFVDQGTLLPCASLWGCMEHSSLKDIINKRGFGLSIGTGLRYILPVGPISLDYAISPIHNEWRIHFQFGYAF